MPEDELREDCEWLVPVQPATLTLRSPAAFSQFGCGNAGTWLLAFAAKQKEKKEKKKRGERIPQVMQGDLRMTCWLEELVAIDQVPPRYTCRRPLSPCFWFHWHLTVN